MSDRQLEPWGGEVHMPRWMRKVLRRSGLAEDTPEARHEKRKEQPSGSVLENADRAGAGPMTQLYVEARTKRPRT